MEPRQEYRYLFGPVHSRRLGLSLGIDVVSAKTCTFNCIFCQLGRTSQLTIERKEYVPAAEVMDELEAYLKNDGRVDYITFSGSGEPTLHSKLGEMIAQTQEISKIPVAVLTCGALLYDGQVRRELALADVVVPSLSTVVPATFKALNRPHGKLHLEEIIAGLKSFRQEYRGQIWLEVMLVKGLNDNAQEMALLHDAIAQIKPDKVHLNTVARPPAEENVMPLHYNELRKLRTVLGANVEIITERPEMPTPSVGHLVVHDLLQLLAHHPATLEEISESLNCKHEIIWLVLNALTETGVIKVREHGGKKFYTVTSREGSVDDYF
jgi:wyosine [tRNA(Phe)-imidazoG37] synthetase (radical SAM superfamily)